MIAGLRYEEMQDMPPGLILDLFVYHREYDDMEHRITRVQEQIFD